MKRIEATDEDRRRFYAEIDPSHLAPMWEKIHELISPEPRPRARTSGAIAMCGRIFSKPRP